MTEITRYVAFDGREFADEYECEDYENCLKVAPIADKVFLWGSDRSPIDTARPSSYADCFYVKFLSLDAVSLFNEFCQYYGSIGFKYPDTVQLNHIYKWSERNDEWIDLKEQVESLVKEITDLSSWLP